MRALSKGKKSTTIYLEIMGLPSSYFNTICFSRLLWPIKKTPAILLDRILAPIDYFSSFFFKAEEYNVITNLTGKTGETIDQIMRLTQNLRTSEDASLSNIANSLSTRQLVRIGEKHAFKR